MVWDLVAKKQVMGVQVRGCTTVLKLNYRYTRQILQFAKATCP